MKLKLLYGLLLLSAAVTIAACDSKDEDTFVQTVCFAAGQPDAHLRPRLLTSMDADGRFYWTQGDKIFVKNGTDYIQSENAVQGIASQANFYLSGNFTLDSSYPVVYTGNGSNSPTTVIIKDEQHQPTANDATHIGTDGDCGNATAARTLGSSTASYSFMLNHVASYLDIAPTHKITSGTNVVLKSIKVETTSAADYICGTYNFSETTSSLANESVSDPGTAVTLTVGDWSVPSDSDAKANTSLLDRVRGFMVIQPGAHTLTFTYRVSIDGRPDTLISKSVDHTFKENYFTRVRHILK